MKSDWQVDWTIGSFIVAALLMLSLCLGLSPVQAQVAADAINLKLSKQDMAMQQQLSIVRARILSTQNEITLNLAAQRKTSSSGSQLQTLQNREATLKNRLASLKAEEDRLVSAMLHV